MHSKDQKTPVSFFGKSRSFAIGDFVLRTILHGNVNLVFPNGPISRPDDLSVIGELFHSVGAPTGNTGNGKDRSI